MRVMPAVDDARCSGCERCVPPLIVGASPLVDSLDTVRKLEDAGVAAITMHSLFEEQIEHEEMGTHDLMLYGAELSPEAGGFFPEVQRQGSATDKHLRLIEQAKKALQVPVIASLNGYTPGGWTRYAKQFEAAGLDQAIAPEMVICSDEMLESAEPEAFQQRLWHMFAHAFGGVMSLQQLDRVRWIMFPEVRVPTQDSLFDDDDPAAELPSVMRVMDLQQEQLARSLGDGHRVIHGVAGSGKTMILAYRAEYLARTFTPTSKPILVLCFNEPLATQLDATFAAKGLADRVHARNFHKWCRQQLVAFGQTLPAQGPGMFDEMVDGVIRAVERRHIPSGQYQAVLIDEGHDFRPEWLKLVTQMVDPSTNSLLLLYDDAQSL